MSNDKAKEEFEQGLRDGLGDSLLFYEEEDGSYLIGQSFTYRIAYSEPSDMTDPSVLGYYSGKHAKTELLQGIKRWIDTGSVQKEEVDVSDSAE